METSKKPKKITLRAPEDEYLALQIHLLKKGKKVNQWFREKMQEELRDTG